MRILKMYISNINDRFMDEVIDTLRNGGIIIYPTDTLYAIGCNALNNNAIERICKIKGINPQRTNLSIVCSDISQASQYARIDNRAYQLLRENLPGAFTFICHMINAVFFRSMYVGFHFLKGCREDRDNNKISAC